MGSRIKKETVLAAIPESGGIVTIIAARLGVAWSTAKLLLEKYPDVKQAYEDELETMLDIAEGKLYENVRAGESQDIKWFLSKRGKKRGYGDAVEINQQGVTRVEIEYVNSQNTTADATPGTTPDQE
jgi:hypothetical protein